MSERLKARLYEVIFGTDTRAGKSFDLFLIVMIAASVAAVTLDSIAPLHDHYRQWFYYVEWAFTVAFTLEYAVRLYCSPRPSAYAKSFFGVIDLLSFLPTYIAFLFPSASYLLVIRLLRLLRIFRILKLIKYLSEANLLLRSIYLSRRKIGVFIFSVMILITIFGAAMYVIEGPQAGFTSIPRGIYWAIVTISTVGYGDLTPHTVLGQFLASVAMLTGYAIIAVPTGIISAEMMSEMQRQKQQTRCARCRRGDHDSDARHCKYCGAALPDVETHPHAP